MDRGVDPSEVPRAWLNSFTPEGTGAAYPRPAAPSPDGDPCALNPPERTLLQEAFQAMHEANVIVEILLDMADADTRGTRPLQGPSVDYLVKQIRVALERIDPALATLP